MKQHSNNHGAGYATKEAFRTARESANDVLVTLDGDGQHNPDEIPQLVAPVQKGKADVVIGSRFLTSQNNVPRYRKFGIDVITFLYNFGHKQQITDSQCCFRAYSRRAIDSLNITENGFAFSIETLIQARKQGLVITEVPVSCTYDADSHTLNPIIHGLSVALSTIRLRLKYRN